MNRQRLKQYRTTLQALYDAACWALGLVLATTLRYDFTVQATDFGGVVRIFPFVVAGQLVAGVLSGMYRGRWRFGSFDEVLALAQGVFLTATLTFLANGLLDPPVVPRSVPVGASVIALVLMGSGRYLWRLTDERRRRPQGGDCRRLLVFGAGEAGAKIIPAMLSNPQSRYLPVALLDDDPAGAPLVTELSDLAVRDGLTVKAQLDAPDIRDISPADLPGRHDSIAGYLIRKGALLTGAGGSTGSALCTAATSASRRTSVAVPSEVGNGRRRCVRSRVSWPSLTKAPIPSAEMTRDVCGGARSTSSQRPLSSTTFAPREGRGTER